MLRPCCSAFRFSVRARGHEYLASGGACFHRGVGVDGWPGTGGVGDICGQLRWVPPWWVQDLVVVCFATRSMCWAIYVFASSGAACLACLRGVSVDGWPGKGGLVGQRRWLATRWVGSDLPVFRHGGLQRSRHRFAWHRWRTNACKGALVPMVGRTIWAGEGSRSPAQQGAIFSCSVFSSKSVCHVECTWHQAVQHVLHFSERLVLMTGPARASSLADCVGFRPSGCYDLVALCVAPTPSEELWCRR